MKKHSFIRIICSILISAVIIIGLIPFQDKIYQDYVALGGYIVLTIAVYLYILSTIVEIPSLDNDKIRSSFQTMPSNGIYYHQGFGEDNNPVEYQIDHKEISLFTNPEENKKLKSKARKGIFLSSIFSPGISFLFFYTRGFYYETEMFFIYAFTVLFYFSLTLVSIIGFAATIQKKKAVDRLLNVVKKDGFIEISAKVSRMYVADALNYNDLIVKIPIERVEEEIFITSINQILKENKEKLPFLSRMTMGMVSKLVEFSPCLSVDRDSEFVETIRVPQMKEDNPKTLTNQFLFFSIADRELIEIMRNEIINWTKS